jgi:hypothetical protein
MDRPKLEVADIFRRYGEAYRQQHGASLSTAQRRVMTAIEVCRTAALGGHLEHCDSCPYERNAYDSCRDRHCPKCQSLARAEWVEKRKAEILATPYFHVVFTLPESIAAIAYQNKNLVYSILFRATAETLSTIAADPQHLGAEIGFFAVLHSWGQNLLFHPHLHCVVPGGGIAPDGSRWVPCRPRFFLPVRVLSCLFRRLFLTYLEEAFDAGKLEFFSSLEALRDPEGFLRHLDSVRNVKWVVYAKAPFAGPQQVVDYVGRYTHRVAISNHRIVDIEDGQVSSTGGTTATTISRKLSLSRPRSSSGDSCSTFCPVDSTAFAITGSWAIDTAKRSYSIAVNSWACLQPIQALPNPSHARTIVIDTRSSPVTLCGNARFVIMAG